MMLFCLVNPGLNAPFNIEFDRTTDIVKFPEDFVANYLNAGNLLAMPGRYYFQRQLYWIQIYNVYRMYSQVNAGVGRHWRMYGLTLEKKHPAGTKPAGLTRTLSNFKAT